ncbi:MAG TPA: glutamate--tRNA ligase [Candidatus Babeliales bacterium]|nr:glutamate--tRNA ligase [Candidatus Babeliales bacterium]
MSKPTIRTRFAPSPTGLMHLGNVRAALMNYLFAQQTDGSFIVRIEDTDQTRNFDPGAKQILTDLAWLQLSFDEGPGKPAAHKDYGSYFQSERTALYNEKLQFLQKNESIYRCFCTQEELEKKRLRQIALKQPPRYDRACLKLSPSEIAAKVAAQTPFIWRMKLNQQQSVTITDLGHGPTTFDFNNFSDFPLTRQDGSVTFMFANCVDDIAMEITHIFRGNDHLSNTAGQVALYMAFEIPLPVYWHLPMICNIEGKKLSKRDFGFSLNDLRNSGFLPEAICNYLAIIGGGSFINEIMTQKELIQSVHFDTIHSSSFIRYDVEKLRWINHKWIAQYPHEELTALARPFLEKQFPAIANMDDATLTPLIQTIKTDIHTLDEIDNEIAFYFTPPTVTHADLEAIIPNEHLTKILALLKQNIEPMTDITLCLNNLKAAAKEQQLPMKLLFSALRLILTGKPNGIGIQELIQMLGIKETKKRFNLLTSNG